jgi:hypothetical protein
LDYNRGTVGNGVFYAVRVKGVYNEDTSQAEVTLNNSNHRHRRQMGEACSTPFSSICHNRNFRKLVGQYRLPVRVAMTSYKSPLQYDRS